jgi:hypothetical protein
MTASMMPRILIILCAFTAFARGLAAQDILFRPDPDSPIGTRNPDAPAGTGQYDFLIGDWDMRVTLFRDGQAPLNYTAEWHNHWVVNGYVVMQEWRGPYSTGMELRSYDEAEDLWHGRNIYVPSPGTWYENTAKWSGDEMIVTTIRTNVEGATSITREIYFGITDSNFSIRTELSTDGGQSWQRGRYELIATRVH